MRINPITNQIEPEVQDYGVETPARQSTPFVKYLQENAPSWYGGLAGVKEAFLSPIAGRHVKQTPSIQQYAKNLVGSGIRSLTGVNPYVTQEYATEFPIQVVLFT